MLALVSFLTFLEAFPSENCSGSVTQLLMVRWVGMGGSFGLEAPFLTILITLHSLDLFTNKLKSVERSFPRSSDEIKPDPNAGKEQSHPSAQNLQQKTRQGHFSWTSHSKEAT